MKKSSNSTSSKPIVDIDPSVIRFTHARIRPFFTGNNFRIEVTINDIVEGRTNVGDLPMITVIENEGHFFSLNNRRLYVLKYLHSIGHLEATNNTIKVFTKKALPREKQRYTVSNCALQATIMKEHTTGETPEEKDMDGSDSEVTAIAIAENRSASTTLLSLLPTSQESTTNENDDKSRRKSKQSVASVASIATGKNSKAKPLDKTVLDSIKGLQKLYAKKKIKPVLSQLEEWVLQGLIQEGLEFDTIRKQIGFES